MKFGRLRLSMSGQLASPLELSEWQIVEALFQGILCREPESSGLTNAVSALRGGMPLATLVRNLIESGWRSATWGLAAPIQIFAIE